MKRRQRRPVLELNKAQGGLRGEFMQNKCKQISKDYHGQNVPANPLANLLCHYNSDSDTEESKKDINNKLDDQVNNFLKEIQLIAPKEPSPTESNNGALTTNRTTQPMHHVNHQASLWQECLDESTGYPYYWHIETNEVTWEMPSELRTLKSNGKLNPVIKPATSQESHWVDFSSIAYQQSHENIPEGMIPREVVARNRNRYMCAKSAQKQKPTIEQETANTSDAVDDDSDDGRIEMITSYGSEESESDTEHQSSNEPAAASVPEPTNTKSITKPKGAELSSSSSVILPQLPCSSSQTQEQNKNDSHTERDSKLLEGKETKYSKSSGKSQRSDGESGKSAKESRLTKESMEDSTKREPELDFRISLVPGYDEDSDGEEEEEKKIERSCLFPIPQDEGTTDSLSLRQKSITCLNKPALSDDNHHVTDNSEHDSNIDRNTDIGREEAAEKESSEISKTDDEKSNIFLDTSHGRNKCFQRKKRIAFEVPLTKAKVTEGIDANKLEIEAQQQEGNSCDAEQETEQLQRDFMEQQKKYTDFTEDTNESIKSPTKETSSPEEEEIDDIPSDSKKEQEEVNALSQIISEKLKFLSEGKPGVSPVQMMAIQLQTLFIAWEGGFLEKSYLRRWLTDTGHELERLEQDAAPPGWLCQWDRSHKRYYYQNATSGVTQWTYPDTGIAGGTEEMEICSTPPPAEQDEIISSESDGIKKENGTAVQTKSESSDEIALDSETRPADIEAPPPPQISNPSPPPPPRIFAEDLKKDKRRRDKNCEKQDNKKKRLEEMGTITEVKLENPLVAQTSISPQTTVLSNIGNTEPLPPGVDLPEAPYELSATALKRILYNTVQQGNTLYDATAREVPILGHPAAIVQEHYLQYPAYHQHIHAPAALVLPHKHAVQPAIQLIPDYTPIYTNHKVIEKPPVKVQKESLVSALDSFYSDIARIEKSGPEQVQVKDTTAEPIPTMQEEAKVETEPEHPIENAVKEKKRKKARIGISKKHKEVSSMVAKWQKALQNFEDNT